MEQSDGTVAHLACDGDRITSFRYDRSPRLSLYILLLYLYLYFVYLYRNPGPSRQWVKLQTVQDDNRVLAMIRACLLKCRYNVIFVGAVLGWRLKSYGGKINISSIRHWKK